MEIHGRKVVKSNVKDRDSLFEIMLVSNGINDDNTDDENNMNYIEDNTNSKDMET